MARGAAAQSNGFEWRILLGPTCDWPIPTLEVEPGTTAQQMTSPGCCELCGEPIGDGKPFITNLTGQRPIHIACSGGDEPTVNGRRPARKTWLCLLQNFDSG